MSDPTTPPEPRKTVRVITYDLSGSATLPAMTPPEPVEARDLQAARIIHERRHPLRAGALGSGICDCLQWGREVAAALTAHEHDELELLRRNRDEDTPGPWIQRAFDALATAQGNAERVETLEAELAALRDDTARVPEGLDGAWAEAEAVLPKTWYISNVRRRSPTGRYSASATLGFSDTGESMSGFGATPAEALRALAQRFRQPPFAALATSPERSEDETE